MTINEGIWEGLINENKIAVHYEKFLKPSVNKEDLENHKNPENYDGKGRSIMGRLKEACDSGVVVFADYN